ncbi:MAG: TIR domain-containing protein, partial [Clostridia bacterium]|nr:TIR domain-containing protein [Clostridia bacterium]
LEKECFKLDSGIYTAFLERDVFVAYSSKDMKEVNRIVEYLESQDITCFVATRNLRHGKGSVENYQNELKTAMNNCKCVVFISSENSRNLGCDALKIELKYIRDNLPNMKRIEYIIQDYNSNTTPVVKNFLKVVFKDLEHCRTLDDLANRVFDIIMNYDNKSDSKENKKENKQEIMLTDILSKLENINKQENSKEDNNKTELLKIIENQKKELNELKERNQKQLNELKEQNQKQLDELKEQNQKQLNELKEQNQKQYIFEKEKLKTINQNEK